MSLQTALMVVSPSLSYSKWQLPLTQAFARFGITEPRRIAAALGQFLVEAGPELSETVENLDYSSPARLLDVYPHEIHNLADAQRYVHNPEELADLVYTGRLGNGDLASGDGRRFIGRGLIQVTGRREYAALASALSRSVSSLPVYLETPEGAAMSGAWWLWNHKCLVLADQWDIWGITRAVNGPAMEDAQLRAEYSNELLRLLDPGARVNVAAPVS
jgi:predicted chitinase